MSTLLYRYLTTTWQPRVNRININAKKKKNSKFNRKF